MKARAQGHSVAEVGGDTFIENFSKCHGGMSHHTNPHSSSAECCVKARARGHSVAEVGGDTFTENFSKGYGGMSHHTIPPAPRNVL
ncbi:MAG: hypothetical protein IPP86_11960 [Bacteroidetes bacterium]|nr:hypothetical protein [Bacteroidota bacterium]